jgi:hypothetical protein
MLATQTSTYSLPHPLYAPRRHDYSPNPGINDTIHWLIEEGLPPLPIAPYQSAYRYPRTIRTRGTAFRHCPLDKDGQPIPVFCGKNPSYLDSRGKPALLNHLPYQARLPTSYELKQWFCHPDTGIATMGGWRDTVWIDLDSKHFPSLDVCREVILAYLDYVPQLKDGVVEITQRGGGRIGCRVKVMPEWSIFSFTPQGKAVGELLGKGKIAVLSPTQGVSGCYQSLQRSTIPVVKDVREISLFRKLTSPKFLPPTRSVKKDDFDASQLPAQGLAVSLYQVASKQVQQLMISLGTIQVGERSHVMTLIAREAFGWNNWLTDHHYNLLIDPEEFLFRVGYELGLDDGRIDRILSSCSNGIPIRESMPGVYFYQGDKGCIDVVRYRSKR